MRDVVLVTVDCWRHDAPDEMDALASLADDYERREVLCQSASTRGAFPSLLCGRYYPQVYTGFSSLRDGVTPLPSVLSRQGYETGAFVGSNPYLNIWAQFVDTFWNDAMATDGDQTRTAETVAAGLSKLRHLTNFLRLRSRVPATAVAKRARRWYESRSGPRFLWMHLMDLHVPFFPGLASGAREGLVDAYRTHYRFKKDPAGLSAAEYETLERLYWRSVESLDARLETVLEFVDDDAHVLLVGDHGEEFDHDGFGHARLYEEVTRVPLYASPGLAGSLGDREHLRQVDVPATLLDAVDCPVPESWVGGPARSTRPYPSFALNHSPQFERIYASIRTDRYKLIETFDAETDRPVATEAYDLREDPHERVDISGAAGLDDPERRLDDLERRLDGFLERDDIRGGIRESPRDVTEKVEDRLQALGYK